VKNWSDTVSDMQSTAHVQIGFIGRCLHQLRLFFIALQFFTRLPVPRWVSFEPAWLQHASRYFPLVGIVVALVASVVYALSSLLWSPIIAALLSTAAGIYLTGAFHEDGFADVCDGFGGGSTPQRVLDIMKDSRIGAYGAIGIGLLLVLKCETLSSLPATKAIAALLIAHPLSRLAATALIVCLRYVKEEGKAKPLAKQMSLKEFFIAAVSASVPVAVMLWRQWLPWQAVACGVATMILAMLWLARIFVRRIGGYTGDCLGAVQQVTEVVFYLTILAWLHYGAVV
jgi:adenosylcobinamide-GDP ribazoletransferase